MYGIFAMKCPRCHEGDIFPNRNPYKLKELTRINERCPVCGQTYHPEPSFYYGAMYVSYGYTVGLLVAVYLLGRFVFRMDMWGIIVALVGVLIILAPYLFRLSRATWLHIFLHYDKDAVKKHGVLKND